MDSIGIYFILFWPALLLFLTLYFSRRAASALENLEEKKPGILSDIAYYALKWITLLLLLGFVVPYVLIAWPPQWIERRHQRREVFQRVESAGGWERLLEDTRIFLSTNDSPSLKFVPWAQTNLSLPMTLQALKPKDIELVKKQESSTALYRIYGYYSTGGRGEAVYWLYVVGDGSQEHALESLRSRFHLSRTFRQITNNVFEVY